PVSYPGVLDERGELILVGVFVVELLQVMPRRENKDRVGPGKRRQEQRVRLRPGVADRRLVDYLEFWRLAAGHHLHGQAARRQLLIADDILKPITEIVGREGLAVRPFVARTQMQRENAPFVDINTEQHVGDDRQRRRVGDEPRIAV